MSDGPMLASALRAAARGWRVFPVRERSKTRPLVRWETAATTDEDQLRDWWSGPWTNANLATVVPDGVVVLDVDPRHRGDETLERWEAEHGAVPRTLTTISGGGGFHLWLKVPDPDDLRQGAHVLGRGVDTRCAGRGVAVLPPSIHPTGGRYRWARGTKEIASAPDWLVDALRKAETPELVPAMGDDRRPRVYAKAALAREAWEVAHTSPGQRNDRLNLAAYRLRRLVVGGQLPEGLAASRLLEAATSAGLGDREARATIASGLGRGVAGTGNSSRGTP